VVHALRRRWRDGTSAVVFEPLDFVARLAALVPRPRAHVLCHPDTVHAFRAWIAKEDRPRSATLHDVCRALRSKLIP
jgi:hypothetical protein